MGQLGVRQRGLGQRQAGQLWVLHLVPFWAWLYLLGQRWLGRRWLGRRWVARRWVGQRWVGLRWVEQAVGRALLPRLGRGGAAVGAGVGGSWAAVSGAAGLVAGGGVGGAGGLADSVVCRCSGAALLSGTRLATFHGLLYK